MKVLKRIAALFMTVIVAVGAFGVVSVSAGADSIYDTAKTITSGKQYEATGIGCGECADYKFTSTKSGTLSLNITAGLDKINIYVYDKDGNTVPFDEYTMISGTGDCSNGCFNLKWNQATEKIKINATYQIGKGTYYIRVQHNYRDFGTGSRGNRKISLTAKFPSTTVTKAKISYLTLTVNKGNTVQLGALVSPSGSKVNWTSSKSSVASVSSKGKVTAKAKGTAFITAKCGSSTQRIQIIVR